MCLCVRVTCVCVCRLVYRPYSFADRIVLSTHDTHTQTNHCDINALLRLLYGILMSWAYCTLYSVHRPSFSISSLSSFSSLFRCCFRTSFFDMFFKVVNSTCHQQATDNTTWVLGVWALTLSVDTVEIHMEISSVISFEPMLCVLRIISSFDSVVE